MRGSSPNWHGGVTWCESTRRRTYERITTFGSSGIGSCRVGCGTHPIGGAGGAQGSESDYGGGRIRGRCLKSCGAECPLAPADPRERTNTGSCTSHHATVGGTHGVHPLVHTRA